MTSPRALPVVRGSGDVARDPGPASPPWPHQPTVEWQVAGHCNYDCSYCIQSPVHRTGQPADAEVDRMLAFLAALPGTWEVKMTGGEPFASRAFVPRIVPALAARGHLISVLTNLSASAPTLERFARAAGDRLSVVSASLHLEFTTVEAFVERLQALRAAAHSGARFVVNAVLAPAHLQALRHARDVIGAAGFTLFPQLMKVKHGVHAYAPAELAIIDELVGGWAQAERRRSANLAPSYAGRRCWAGARYFVLTQTGDAWACRTAKRHGESYLGNVHAGDVALAAGPLRCPYPICPCAVPANRGMIEGVPARGAEAT